jgi:protoporphyrinogen/coproporphyrinogen III oxidase
MKHVAVVGGGIAGLTSALRLAEAGFRVTLVEATQRPGGKICTGPGGVETGAEQFLLRDPATGGPGGALRLVDELGLSDLLVHPVTAAAGLWVDGVLTSLPGGTVMGVPGEGDLDGIALADRDLDLGEPVLGPGADVAVGELVRARLGDEVVEHLVDPLLGGVYAGRADRLSLQATMPALHKLLQSRHTLRGAVSAATAASRTHASGGPVFGTLRGGLSQLIDAVAQRLTALGVDIHYGRPLRNLDDLPADGYVLACPFKPAAALLDSTGPAAGLLELNGTPVGPLDGSGLSVDYASVGLITLRLPAFDLPDLSGFLVPADQGLSVKAATFFSRKWAHHAGDHVVLRASIGRYGDVAALQQTDEALVDTVCKDLATILGPMPEPVGARVTRWGGGLPQYAPGHVTRVARLRAALADRRIALAGAAFDAVGIPACITSGEKAAIDLGESLS